MLKQLETSFLFRKIKQPPKSTQREEYIFLKFSFDCTLFIRQVMEQIGVENNVQLCSFFEK